MSFTIRQERFSPFGGDTIDVCPGCGEDIVSADWTCVRVEPLHGPQSRFHEECFREYVNGLQLFSALTVLTQGDPGVVH